MSFRFASSDYFFYLWIIPVIILLSYILVKRTNKNMMKAFGSKVYPFLTGSISQPKRNLKWLFEILTITLMLLALARPQMGSSLQKVKSEGVEMIIAVDVSQSMMTEDVRPNRLELTKIEIKRLFSQLSGDKVGLVAFAGSAFVLSPLTTDYSALGLFLDSLSTDSVSTQGTNFKLALEEARDAFKRGGVETDETSVVTRVVAIFSDGEDHEEGALTLASQMNNEGTKIYTMGLGTAQGAPVPVRDDRGYLKGYLKDSSGQVVNSTHKGEFMMKLASQGGGKYFHVNVGGDHVSQFKSQIDRLQKAQFESSLSTEYDERFQIFLLLAIILGMIELLLGETKAGLKRWKGRFELGLVLIALQIPMWKSHALTDPRSIINNNKAAELIETEKNREAYQKLIDSLSQTPFQAELHLNLGYVFEKNTEWDKAIQEYLSAANLTEDTQLKFEAYFNAARVKAEQKKKQEAVELYQKALEYNPESIEVKTNIEILLSEQSGGGGGGDSKDQNSNKDQKDQKQNESGEDEKKDEEKQNQNQNRVPNPPPKPKPFKSENLSERDVKNILEELRRQEEKIRAKTMDQKKKESPSGPNW